MSAPDQAVFLWYVWRAWRRAPTQRFGQVVVNALGRDDPFYVEDALARAKFKGYPETGAIRKRRRG